MTKGKGLFARGSEGSIVFREDDIIAPYYGPHSLSLPEKSDYVYTVNGTADWSINGFVYLNIPQEYHINPQGTQTNVARYANHCRQPNATVVPIVAQGHVFVHPFLMAIKDIPANEEIVFDYGRHFPLTEEQTAD